MSRSDPSGAGPGDTLLAGASGLIGRAFATQWRGPGQLHLLVRRPMPAPGPMCRVQVVDFGALPALPRAAAAVCCLGTTIAVAGSPQAFRAVDLDAVLAFARAAQAAGVQHFAVVSALGADARASGLYSRTKGEMEADLAALGFASLIVARPSLLAGDRAALGQPLRRAEALALALTRPLARLVPKAWRPIEATTVARALGVALGQAQAQVHAGTRVLSSAALQDLGRAAADRP
jgi:uncharacterized protein YbjT (DUF2867 family)